MKIRKRFLKKSNESVGVPNMWGHFKDWDLRACDQVSGKKSDRRSKGDTWWQNEAMNDAISRKMHTWRCVWIVLMRI